MGNRIVLSGLGGPLSGLNWEGSEVLRIGRNPCAEVCLNDASISREHAEVFVSRQGWSVRDLGSAGGTLVNSMPVGQSPRKLEQNDVLQCGKLFFKVTSLETAAAPPSPRQPLNIRTTGEMVRVQALAQRTWEQAVEDLVKENHQLNKGSHFLTLIRAGYHLSRIDSLAQLLQTLLDDIVTVLDARSGAVALVDENTRELALRIVSGHMDPVRAGRYFSKTLANRCFSKGESFLCADVEVSGSGEGSGYNPSKGMASIICALLRSPRGRFGVLHLERGASQEPFSQKDFFLVDAIAANISVGIESAQGLEKQRLQFFQEVSNLAGALIENRHPALARHSRRVGRLALVLAAELQLPESEKNLLQAGALFHDLGKIFIPDAILQKRSKLSTAETQELQSHPVRGVQLAQTISCLQPILPIIRHHHEHWDGTGYPDGLVGEHIPRLARILAVADALENLTAAYPRDPAGGLARAGEALAADSGRRFDPEGIAALHRAQPKLIEVIADHSDPAAA